MSSPLNCLVTGASGYIGGRLVPELLSAGYAVRCMARDPGKLSDRPWSDDVEIAVADVMEGSAVRRALEGVDVAYYLIHSLGTDASFERRDRTAAEIFGAAAKVAGVQRIVYLGGIISRQDGKLSPHLRSRAEVGDILLASGVPTAALQAAVIIGSGSASFEMLRYLTERLPAMVTPQWVDTRIQPIAVRDVLRYLAGSATLPADVSRRFDIGGPDVLSYVEMMRRYADVAALTPRAIVKVPILTPRLSSLWVGLVTPVPANLARPLVESLRNEVVCSRTTSPGTSRSARRAADPRSGHRRGPPLHPRGRRLDPLVVGRDARRTQRPAADRPVMGRRIPLRRRAAQRGARLTRGAVAGDRGHRRRDRVVLLPGRLGRPRAARPAGRRGRTAARPPRPAASAHGRRLVSGGWSDRVTAAAARGDGCRAGLAGAVR
jgi:uncharacterized protein YbjT (DUF2867 family)